MLSSERDKKDNDMEFKKANSKSEAHIEVDGTAMNIKRLLKNNEVVLSDEAPSTVVDTDGQSEIHSVAVLDCEDGTTVYARVTVLFDIQDGTYDKLEPIADSYTIGFSLDKYKMIPVDAPLLAIAFGLDLKVTYEEAGINDSPKKYQKRNCPFLKKGDTWPSGYNFVAVEGSVTGHGCCFEASVVDMRKPVPNSDPIQYDAICETFYVEDAIRIAGALNA